MTHLFAATAINIAAISGSGSVTGSGNGNDRVVVMNGSYGLYRLVFSCHLCVIDSAHISYL